MQADAFNDKLEAGIRLTFLIGLGFIFLTSDAGGVSTLLKRPARLYEGGQGPSGITFADVAGCDEAKAELAEVVDFLKAPSRYKALGARVPRGVMLVGPPGTGKTLLAKAVAGEAGTPFFAASASEFVELYVGLGGRRIRSLFAEARKRAPCVIFIDELDAVGRARAAGTGANVAGVANEEREQTLNQLLTEMDGFEAAADAPPVIVLAATNRPDALDAALKRPGRFDRTVAVAAPDRAGRAAILRVHMRKLGPAAAACAEAIADDVAAVTTGMTGAELANVVNEAALLAARRGGDAVTLADFAAAAERAVAGLERRSLRVSASERRIVALHEAGHAIVAALCPEEGGAKVNKVSIVPRASGALGVTLRDPGDDRFLATELALRSALATLMGGRAAERVAVGALTSGASDDIRRATAIATDMVTNYGMCPAVGPRAVATAASAQMAMPPPPPGAALAATVDTEVAALLRGADDWAVAAVSLNLGLATEMATTLLAEEALGGSQLAAYLARAQAPDGFVAWLETGRGAAPDAAASSSAGQAAGNGRH
jgi:cell division protease FtsH